METTRPLTFDDLIAAGTTEFARGNVYQARVKFERARAHVPAVENPAHTNQYIEATYLMATTFMAEHRLSSALSLLKECDELASEHSTDELLKGKIARDLARTMHRYCEVRLPIEADEALYLDITREVYDMLSVAIITFSGTFSTLHPEGIAIDPISQERDLARFYKLLIRYQSLSLKTLAQSRREKRQEKATIRAEVNLTFERIRGESDDAFSVRNLEHLFQMHLIALRVLPFHRRFWHWREVIGLINTYSVSEIYTPHLVNMYFMGGDWLVKRLENISVPPHERKIDMDMV